MKAGTDELSTTFAALADPARRVILELFAPAKPRRESWQNRST
jgi:hypothetical protein